MSVACATAVRPRASFGVVLDETVCGDCKTALQVIDGTVVCGGGCQRPMYGGMLLLDGSVARCTAPDCGWTGVPTFMDGEALSWCPSCEQADLIAELMERQPFAQRVVTVKVSRNAPCPCKSGKKAKRCCYR